MDKKWILDVLGDLHDYADEHGMPDTALHLGAALRMAQREAFSHGRDAHQGGAFLRVVEADGTTAGTVYRKTGTGGNA